ncbi:hypothetical protein GCM10011587_19000 [Pyruvatibacter mobilis]|nr:hypothetical protein GCM10011587_19000 [Pyruvatibacter mobilis]
MVPPDAGAWDVVAVLMGAIMVWRPRLFNVCPQLGRPVIRDWSNPVNGFAMLRRQSDCHILPASAAHHLKQADMGVPCLCGWGLLTYKKSHQNGANGPVSQAFCVKTPAGTEQEGCRPR